MSDEDILACKPVEMLTAAQAATTGSILRRCRDCERRVWLVPRNLLLGARVVCLSCAAARLAQSPAIVVPAKPFVDELQRDEQN